MIIISASSRTLGRRRQTYRRRRRLHSIPSAARRYRHEQLGVRLSVFVFVSVSVSVSVFVFVCVRVREWTGKQSSGAPVSRPVRICILHLASSSNLQLPASVWQLSQIRVREEEDAHARWLKLVS